MPSVVANGCECARPNSSMAKPQEFKTIARIVQAYPASGDKVQFEASLQRIHDIDVISDACVDTTFNDQDLTIEVAWIRRLC